MFSTLFSAALLASFALQGAYAADALVIDTVTITQCSDAHITWRGGKASYNLIAVDAANPCDSVLADLGDHSGTSMTWKNVPLKAGTQIQLSLEDADEQEAWTGTITVGKSEDSSCLSGSSTSGSDSGSASGSTSGTLSGATSASLTATSTSTSATVAVGGVEASPSSSAAAVGPVGAAGAGIGQSSASGAASVRASITLLGALAAAAVYVL